MRLLILIKLSILFSSALSFAGPESDTIPSANSPYRSEYNPWFTFGKFKRGFSNDSLKFALDSLEAKPRRIWTRQDSLVFASTSLKTGNHALADYYFDHLHVDFASEESFWYDHLMIYMLENEYTKGLQLIRHVSPGMMQFSKLDFFERIFKAKQAMAEDPKWYKTNEVLNWHYDSTKFDIDRKSEEYQQLFIQPLENLNEVLTIIIHYVHEEDAIIADVCFEMGLILEHHVSYTQAYIAYSLGRHYNKWDKEILNELKRIKAKMMERKYKIPVFRKHFPRIEYWRFDYNVLKEQILLERNDTITKEKPVLIQPDPNARKGLGFPAELITIGGVLIMLLLVVFFLRPAKK